MQTIELRSGLATDASKPSFLPLSPHCARVLGNYWKPNPMFVSELAGYLQGRKVLEIFAGNGYLAGLLSARGVDITSTTVFSGHDAHERGLYFPVHERSATDAVLEFGDSHDVLLVCWPTVTKSVLLAALLWGVDKPIVFIGEITDYTQNVLGGCATDEFFEHFAITKRFSTYGTRKSFEHAVVGQIASTKITSIGR